jgi:hypothetical protein
MRVVPALVASGLAAAALVVPAAAQAAPVKWTESSRAGYFSLTSVKQGDLKGHQGNWHTVVLVVSGADGVSGTVADWTCADGVEPNFADVGAEWTCAPESYRTIEDAVDDEGASRVRITVNRPTRNLVVWGNVSVTDDEGLKSGGWLKLRGHATGDRIVTVVDSEDGQTRTSTVVRGKTKARGKVLGIVFHAKGFERSTSDLASVTSYVRTSKLLPRF